MILGPPDRIDDATSAFCATLSPIPPVYVPVRPVPEAKWIHCFDNSVAQASREGGAAVYGWAVWHWPGRWFEAEHHAVWRSPAGELVDVTPQTGEPERVLFVEDPAAPYDPTTFRRNVMAPDAENPLAREYIELVGQRAAITDPYWTPGTLVLPLFSEADRARIAPIDARMAELFSRMA